MHDDPVTDERPEMPTVFDRLVAAGLSQERIEQHLTAGRVRVDGELVTDQDRPAPAPRAGRAVDGVSGSRIPWRVGTAGCGAYDTTGHMGAPRQCSAPVMYAGLRAGGVSVEAWLAFSCHHHRDQLTAARELLDRDRVVLDDWRERERRALAGQKWIRRSRSPSGPAHGG
jgi:hypothetical protein